MTAEGEVRVFIFFVFRALFLCAEAAFGVFGLVFPSDCTVFAVYERMEGTGEPDILQAGYDWLHDGNESRAGDTHYGECGDMEGHGRIIWEVDFRRHSRFALQTLFCWHASIPHGLNLLVSSRHTTSYG